jgi:hypothetical protein
MDFITLIVVYEVVSSMELSLIKGGFPQFFIEWSLSLKTNTGHHPGKARPMSCLAAFGMAEGFIEHSCDAVVGSLLSDMVDLPGF